MTLNSLLPVRKGLRSLLAICCYVLLVTIIKNPATHQQDSLTLKTETITIDLQHKIGSQQEFKHRATLVIRPKTEYRVAQASITNQIQLSAEDLAALREASEKGDAYYLRAIQKKKIDNKLVETKTTQTLVKLCSLYTSNLVDFITVNLSPVNEFINVNFFTADPECLGELPTELSTKFNTTILVESGQVGPTPDTATYVKRLEEERQSKAREGKEDNRSFFAKYWIYIVPAIVILMMISGPEQGAR